MRFDSGSLRAFPRRSARPLPPLALVGEGILAGLAGTAAMTLGQTRLLPRLPIPEGPQPRRKPEYPEESVARREPTTETAARRIASGLAHRPLTPRQRKIAGNVLHFAFGGTWGALLALLGRRPTVPQGLLFGAAVWMISDNGLLPLLRLGSWPNRYPPGVHAKALLAHLIYGAGTAWTLRRLMPAQRC